MEQFGGEQVQAVGEGVDLHDKGWAVETVDCTAEGPDVIAARIVPLIYHTLGEKSPVCL